MEQAWLRPPAGALMLGVPRALGLDLDNDALAVAAANARINGLEKRLELKRAGPETAGGRWPLIVANLVAASLVELAPAIARRSERDLRGVKASCGGAGILSCARHA